MHERLLVTCLLPVLLSLTAGAFRAHYDALIAAQDAKYHHWTARPNEFVPERARRDGDE
jgi:hypothetical protein